MKRIIFALFLLPQLAYAQYRTEIFNLNMSEDVSLSKIEKTFSQDTILILDETSKIFGLSISGTAVLNNANDSHIRVTLMDKYNYEFLVYENYPTLSDNSISTFKNIALETVLLDDIVPQYLKIDLLNASLKIESVNYTTSKHDTKNHTTILKSQTQYIINKLNANLKKRNMTWRAGMTSVSELTYSEKKDLFGGSVPKLYGFEHYIGGVFVLPNDSLNSSLRSLSSTQYVSEWDWRNRHGKNWMTSVKYHINCMACWAFASISTIEAYANLYYNNLINLDLSEEEIISCSYTNGCNGGTEYAAFNYVKNYGVVNELCFPYMDTEINCSEKCDNPDERIFIQNHRYIPINEDSVKHNLFRCPLTIAIGAWAHSMVIVGYKTIEIGDTIYMGNNSNAEYIIINANEHQNLIGSTAWLLKNSWQPWGNSGYLYLIVDMNYPNVWRVQSLTGEIMSLNYDDSDIICEDADGDGYYFWGIGNKPANCPSWVPDTPDGDDSNINLGVMDDYGNLQSLQPNGVTICSSVVYNTNQTITNRIGIVKNGTLVITGTTTMSGNSKIRVCENGTLIVDGGTIQNANIELIPGCHVIVCNNGTINMASGYTFDVPKGAVIDVYNGTIN